jgi:F0F1-type ATP synthase epsilon subunit
MEDFFISSENEKFYSFNIDNQKGHDNAVSSILELGPKNRFINRSIEISTKSDKGRRSFYKKNTTTGKWNFLSTYKKNGSMSIKTYHAGLYCVIEDNEKPEITYVEKKPYYYIYLSDGISGINPDSIKVMTDNIKQEHYFDIDRKMITVHTDKNTSEINVSVRDNENNLTVKTIEIK